MTTELYQFPISHYCEKARWALDYKGVPWRAVNLMPGLHRRTTRAMAQRSSVPVLVAGEEAVQGSSAIISWLDQRHPDKPLTPTDPSAAEQAIAWEKRLDRDLGVHVRRFAYHTLLDHPSVVIPMLTHGCAWWSRPLLTMTFSKLSKLMRKGMRIDELGALESQQVIEQTLDDIVDTLSRQPYLAGDAFSRADLTAAALAAPLFMPPGYGLPWPDALPDPLASWVAGQQHRLEWARQLYRDYRGGHLEHQEAW